MVKPNERRHINERTLKFLVGVIALGLAGLTEKLANLVAGTDVAIGSISAAYHEGGWARDYLVGLLFTIGAFLLAYNGDTTFPAVLAKVGAFAAIGVAVFPCGCGNADEIIPYVHYISAAVMFSVLATYCGIFYRNARAKHRRQADWRAYIYATSGLVMVLAMALLLADHLLGETISAEIPRLVFHGEQAALVAFGVSWLVASRVLPIVTAPDERKFD